MAARKRSKKPRAKKRADPVSEISVKMERLERKIDLLRKQQENTEDDVEESLEAAEETEKDVEKIEHGMGKMGDELGKIEETVVRISKFSIGRRHFTEIARGTAGAFIGVSVGMGLRWMPIFAEQIEWTNAIAILVFILALGATLLFKTEKEWIKKEGNIFVVKRLMHLFFISLGVVMLALLLFNMIPEDPNMLIKTLIVGSYPAMSGAITFTIT